MTPQQRITAARNIAQGRRWEAIAKQALAANVELSQALMAIEASIDGSMSTRSSDLLGLRPERLEDIANLARRTLERTKPRPCELEPWVVYSADEDAFYSACDGWVDLARASFFTSADSASMRLTEDSQTTMPFSQAIAMFEISQSETATDGDRRNAPAQR